MASIEFTVPGNPVPCERPRVVKGRAFTPKRSKDYQARVKDAYWGSIGTKVAPKLQGELKAFLTFYRADRRRVDLDNLVKSVQDALNGVAFEDDSQISSLVALKGFDRDNPRAFVSLCEIGMDKTILPESQE